MVYNAGGFEQFATVAPRGFSIELVGVDDWRRHSLWRRAGVRRRLLVALTAVAEWAQWALFALLAGGSMVLFRARIYRKVRGHPPEVRRGPSGDELTLPAALAPEESCQAEHAGSFWTVQNDSEMALSSGARVRVVRVQGMTLLVRPAG
jgi:membrane protein implicated in regulation of membrane protease activity